MKGIVLAGGTGSRLWPITRTVSKQLLPVYDKPMIYYPISTLMLAGIREILLITTPEDQIAFKLLLGTGEDFGVSFTYAIQPEPKGLAQALLIGETFLAGESCLMVLGDNIFHGVGLGHELVHALPQSGAHIFTYEVANPSEYGVLGLDQNRLPKSITEKPTNPVSNLAITGMYYFDKKCSSIAADVTPSLRGELEITSVLNNYLERKELSYTPLSRGTAWLDTGKPNTLHDAATFIRVIEERTGLKIGCLEEIAWRNGWKDSNSILNRISTFGNSSYYEYLRRIISVAH
jgi:glucose-1-phosphate thymidylyltransferase